MWAKFCNFVRAVICYNAAKFAISCDMTKQKVDFFKQYEPYIQRKDAKIIQQAEEIGRLREQIVQLKDRLQKSADAANTETTANAG